MKRMIVFLGTTEDSYPAGVNILTSKMLVQTNKRDAYATGGKNGN